MKHHSYLITGGTGFIGQALCRDLARDGAQLTILSRAGNGAARRVPDGARLIRSLAELGAGDSFDAVINLAGEPIAGARWTPARKQVLENSRIALTQQLVDWIRLARKKPDVLISGSAIGFYGDQGDRPVNENSKPQPDYAHELCHRWEETARRAETLGVRVAIVRIGLVIGPNGGFLRQMALPFWFGVGGPIGSGDQWMSWIHRDDLIGMIRFLLADTACQGVFNGTAPNPVTNRAFAQTLGRVIRRPSLMPAPALAFRLAFGEMASLLTSGQRVEPERALSAGFDFGFPELEAALRSAYA